MIKEAINRILELAPANVVNINGQRYSDKKLYPIDQELRANAIEVYTLKSLVDYVLKVEDFKPRQYIINVVSPTEVYLMSSLDEDREREILVVAKAKLPSFKFGFFYPAEEFIIHVQSKFADRFDHETDKNNDKPVILQFAGNVKAGTISEYGDDGVGQKATIKRGVATMQEVEIPSPCVLAPYRTFLEVCQPESSFIFRAREGEKDVVNLALFEADGGAWEINAMDNIRRYLEDAIESKNSNIVII